MRARNHLFTTIKEMGTSATRAIVSWWQQRTQGKASNRKRLYTAIWARYRSYTMKKISIEDSTTSHLKFWMILEYPLAKRPSRPPRVRGRRPTARWRAKCFHKCATTSIKTRLCLTGMSAACLAYKTSWWVETNKTSFLKKEAWWTNLENTIIW